MSILIIHCFLWLWELIVSVEWQRNTLTTFGFVVFKQSRQLLAKRKGITWSRCQCLCFMFNLERLSCWKIQWEPLIKVFDQKNCVDTSHSKRFLHLICTFCLDLLFCTKTIQTFGDWYCHCWALLLSVSSLYFSCIHWLDVICWSIYSKKGLVCMWPLFEKNKAIGTHLNCCTSFVLFFSSELNILEHNCKSNNGTWYRKAERKI